MLPRQLIAFLGFAVTAALGQTTSPFQSGVWSGNLTATSASVVVRLNASGLKVRLAVSTTATLAAPVYSSAANTAATAGNTLTLSIANLVPDTDYYYGIEVASVLRTEAISRGHFHTFPLGHASFRIALGGDGDFRAADQRAYDAIVAENPLLFIHVGDLHYNDTNTTNPDDYRTNYDSVLNQPNESALYRAMPLAYMWDDHDFCGNDSDTTFAGRDTARSVYKERTPHYPIGPSGGAIGQSFTVGRVRIIMTDLRSAASSPSVKDNASKTKLGTAQKTWFKQELIAARDGGFPLALWICPDPWVGNKDNSEDDSWANYSTERTEIANFIRDNHISNLAIVSGDMHAIAYDDGTHSDYATGGGAPIVVLHAASLTAPGSFKGGPYTGGPIAGPLNFGILEIYDNGGPSIACRFLGHHVGDGGRAPLSYIFSSSLTTAGDHALGNISTLARLSSGTDSITSGFVVTGNTPRTMLIRAVGPTLAEFGVTDALPQPVLTVYQGAQSIGTNAGWSTDSATAAQLSAAFDTAGAFRFGDGITGDAAILLTLAPGPYTVQVHSGTGDAGSTLIEVYDLP